MSVAFVSVARAQPTVTGASAVPAERIAAIARSLDTRTALDSLHALYSSLGYLGAHVEMDSATIRIVEGRRYALAGVEIRPDSLRPLLADAAVVSPGEYFTSARVAELLEELVRSAARRGYPLARARIEDLIVDDSAATVRLVVVMDRLETITISEIDVRGNTETRRSLILAASGLRGGERFSEELAERVQTRLLRLDIFASVALPELYRTDSAGYGLLLRVQEGRPNTIDGILGFQPPTSERESGALVGQLLFVLRNLFGGGRGISVQYERTRPSERIDVRYVERYFLGVPLDLEFGYLQLQEDAAGTFPGYVQRVVDGLGSYGFLDAWTVLLGGAFDETIPELDTGRACSSTLFNSRTLRSTLGVGYDSRDYFVSPTSGVLYGTSVTVGNKVVRNGGSCPDSLVPTSEFRQRIDVDLDAYASPLNPLVLVFKAHYGEIRGNTLEASDLLRMGGQSTVRGYREDQFRASRRGWATLEPRFPLTRDSYIGAFVDAGYFLRPEDRLAGTPRQEEWLVGYGVTAQVATPLGLASVSYALSRDDTFETGKVFFGLVNRF